MDNMGIYKETLSSAGIMGRNPPKAKGTPGRVKSKINPAMKNRNKVKTKTEAEKKLERLKAANKRRKSITTFKKRKPAKKLAR